MTAPEVVDRMQRLYQRRRFDEAPESQRKNLVDPYNNESNNFLFDMIIVLNYFEALCYEIEKKKIYEKYIFEGAKDTVIGILDSLMPRYEKLTGVDQKPFHPHIVNVGNRWRDRMEKKGLPLQEKIPDPVDGPGGG